MPFFPGAMPFFRAPCPFFQRHAFKMCPFLPKCYHVECDAIELTATPNVLVHGTPEVARPPDASQLPLYVRQISDFIDWRKPFDQRGSEHFADHTWENVTLTDIQTDHQCLHNSLHINSVPMIEKASNQYTGYILRYLWKVYFQSAQYDFIFTTWCSDIFDFPTSLFTVRNIIWIWRLVL